MVGGPIDDLSGSLSGPACLLCFNVHGVLLSLRCGFCVLLPGIDSGGLRGIVAELLAEGRGIVGVDLSLVRSAGDAHVGKAYVLMSSGWARVSIFTSTRSAVTPWELCEVTA